MGFIDFPQHVWFRRALFQIHLWTGVGLGLYILAISISGSILVFPQDALDDTQNSGSASSAPLLSFGESVRLAREVIRIANSSTSTTETETQMSSVCC